MSQTRINSEQVGDGEIKRVDLCTSISGSAVITKVIAGTLISLSSTGADPGTGDVTISIPTTATPTFASQVLSSGAGNVDILNLKTGFTTSDQYLGILFTRSTNGADIARIAAVSNGPAKGRIVFYTRDAALAEVMRIESDGKVGIGVAAPKALLHGAVSTIVGCAAAAAADADIGNSQLNIWVSEGDPAKLKFKVKLSGGTIKNGEISLT